MKTPGETNTCGVVKHVFDDLSEADIESSIKSMFPEAECDFFKRKSDGKFTGMIKVDFRDRETLQKVTKDRLTIGSQRYIVEEYKRKSRVVKCNKCQGWGHIHRYCNREPKCGKCSAKHETESCTIISGFKCAHCNEDHKAGSSVCKVFREKMALFSTTYHYE